MFRRRQHCRKYKKINNELFLYSKKLVKKKQVVIGNKMDLLDSEERLLELKNGGIIDADI